MWNKKNYFELLKSYNTLKWAFHAVFWFKTYKTNIFLRYDVEEEICYEIDVTARKYSEKFNFSNPSEFVDYLRNLTMQRLWFNDSYSIFKGKSHPAFAETLTRLGIGFSFNMMKAEDLMDFSTVSKDFFYEFNDDAKRPFKDSIAGNGMEITFTRNRHRNLSKEICRESAFVVHSSNEIPSSFKTTDFKFPFDGEDLDVLITPVIVEADENLRTLSSERRQCYFQNERKLKYFKTYTKRNCDLECLSNLTYSSAGCVLFNVIRDETMDICDHTTRRFTILKEKNSKNQSCNCLPLCNSITYATEILNTRFSVEIGEEWV